jgi:dienelactone hydrolase
MQRLRSLVAAALLMGSAGLGGKAQVSRAGTASEVSAVHALFNLGNLDNAPFPTDRFTVADDRNLTRRRVNLPKPADCVANKSECEDVDVLNQLDGFSLRPRVTIPFDGTIDPATVKGNAFFVSIGDTTDNWTDMGPDSMPTENVDRENLRKRKGFGQVTGINQIVWDPATRVLVAKSDSLLDEHTRYALVVTNGIRDATGKPIAVNDSFREYRNKLNGSDDRWYRKTLLAAEWAARHSDGAGQNDVVAISSFTTQSVSYLREKITQKLLQASPPVAADFNIGPNGSRAMFAFDQIESIRHNQQVSPGGPPQPGEAYNLTGSRWVQGAVGQIAYGRFTAPDFMVHPGEYIPPIPTRTGSPKAQGSNTLYFTLILPSGPKPAGGWPVVVFGHGGNGTSATTPLEIASIPASHGLALICINLVGHGRGPASTLTIKMKDGSTTTLPMPGRGIDQNGDGVIATAEGHYATAPRLISLDADAVTQIGADQLSLVRLIQRGIDGDGDGQTDLNPARIYSLGQSLGAITSIPFAAYTPAVRASFFIVPAGTLIEIRRMSTRARSAIGSLLAGRIPSLINAPNGLPSIGGVRVDEPFFNENIPVRDVPPLINTVPGAMAIQRLFDRIEWRGETGDAAVFARRLSKSPPAGIGARPTVIFIGRGDQSAPLADSASLIREGSLEDRTVLYRHDLFSAANPSSIKNSHAVYRFQGATAPTNPITVAIQEQFSQFFASDGTLLKQTSPYLETPLSSALPKDLDYIP